MSISLAYRTGEERRLERGEYLALANANNGRRWRFSPGKLKTFQSADSRCWRKKETKIPVDPVSHEMPSRDEYLRISHESSRDRRDGSDGRGVKSRSSFSNRRNGRSTFIPRLQVHRANED